MATRQGWAASWAKHGDRGAGVLDFAQDWQIVAVLVLRKRFALKVAAERVLAGL